MIAAYCMFIGVNLTSIWFDCALRAGLQRVCWQSQNFTNCHCQAAGGRNHFNVRANVRTKCKRQFVFTHVMEITVELAIEQYNERNSFSKNRPRLRCEETFATMEKIMTEDAVMCRWMQVKLEVVQDETIEICYSVYISPKLTKYCEKMFWQDISLWERLTAVHCYLLYF